MGGFAWVTLATNDSYSLGALVLAHSLRRVGTKHDLAVLVTPGVTGAMREKLSSVFSLVQEVNVLDSKDEANLALLARPELGITFTKLHCWRLTQYEKCVFVDADALVIKNCDELFEREELSAAPDVGWPDCFNSGVFVFKPSQQTFASLTSFAAAKGSFDGGDQGLLNQYFSDWAHKDISKHLPFIYNMCSTATYSYLPAYKQFGEDVRIIHFIGITKPWLQYFDTVTSQVQPAPGSQHLLPLLQLWWNIFCDNVHPQLSPVMAGIAGALAKITLGEARSQEQVAFEEHMRKQGWEQGQIDYMGRDSFDNIWKKISETLSVQPESKPSPPKVVPQLPKVETEKKAAVLPGEEEPAATKPEAAVLAELERTDQQDQVLGEVAHESKELISPLTELTRGGTSESTILTGASLGDVAETTKAVGSIAPTSCDVDTVKSAPCGDLETEKTGNVEILAESQVPIQVAESVLEADVKESVSEDLKPVTEEAFSSISLSAQESVPAVLETAMEAVDSIAPRPNGTASPVGNGIDALCCPANGLASATVAVVERPSDVVVVVPSQLQDPRDPVVSSAALSDPEGNVPAEFAQPTPPTAPPLTEILEKSTELSAEPPTASQESVASSPVQTASVLVEKSRVSRAESVATAVPETKTTNVPEKQETADSTSPDVTAEPAKPQEPEAPVCTNVDEPKLPAPASTETPPVVCPAKPSKNVPESPEKTEKSKSSSTVPETLPESATEGVTKTGVDKDEEKLEKSISDDPKASPKDSKASATSKKDAKDTSTKKVSKTLVDKDPLKVSITKEIPKVSAEEQGLGEAIEKAEAKKSIEASTEESSPVRPARTKELKIPDTPTIIEATPPTSPPIGGAESLEEQQQPTKVTKKVVKKVIKKTSEAKPGDGSEAEGECKKVTKKIVKKVVKKKDEEGNPTAEATSATEKPKKIVKIVKKTTKTTSQTLDAEAAVPETPPPGLPEVPVPPKRKIKTTTKTTTLKSDSEQ